MLTSAIIYYSGYGHTAKQAEAVRQGVAEVKGTQVNVYRIDKDGTLPEASLDAIAKADAVIYGAPRIWAVQPGSSRNSPMPHPSRGFRRPGRTKLPVASPIPRRLMVISFQRIEYFWTLSQQHGQIWVGTGLMPSNTKAHGSPMTSTGQVDMQVRSPFHRLTPRPMRRRAAATL